MVITTGWAFAVAVPALIFGVYSGAHFNPALTIAFAAIGKVAWAQVPVYLAYRLLLHPAQVSSNDFCLCCK